MDYMARLNALSSKLEREDLTEAEELEIKLIHSMSLLALLEENKKAVDKLCASLNSEKN
jgi:hypothetical protein